MLLSLLVQAERKGESGPALKRQRVDFPVVDPDRKMPDNFDPTCKDAYMTLPTEALPRGPSFGRWSYTILPPLGWQGKNKIEVLLRTKAFFLHRGKAQGATEGTPGPEEPPPGTKSKKAPGAKKNAASAKARPDALEGAKARPDALEGAKARPDAPEAPPGGRGGAQSSGNTISWSKFQSVKDAYEFARQELGWPLDPPVDLE
jgi:hypothetical protein